VGPEQLTEQSVSSAPERRGHVPSNTIGKVALNAGVGVETVRFYERTGLIEQPPRRGKAFREYPTDTVRRIRFVVHAKELGFSLKEIVGLLSLRSRSAENCDVVKQQVVEKIADMEGRIRHLRRMTSSLRKLTQACERRAPTAECPLWDVLDEEDHAS
jgi:MerR family mercuric resistance operon transcriptional regulator